jgi:hypothetical protein
MQHNQNKQVTTLIGIIRWNLDRCVIETSYGNTRDAVRHRDQANQLAARVRTLDASPAIANVLRELMFD